MNIYSHLAPDVALTLYHCLSTVELSPEQAVDALYFQAGGCHKVIQLMQGIHRYPQLQEHPKLRELYRQGRIKLERTRHLLPANYLNQEPILRCKREEPLDGYLSECAGSPEPRKKARTNE